MNYQQFSWPTAVYYFEQPWTLDGTTYIFTMRYNLRVATWMMDVADATETPIVCGVPLVAGRSLLGQHTGRDLPTGILFVYDPSGKDLTPGQDDFSLQHALVYAAQSAA